MTKIFQLPGDLKATESDADKVREAFSEKLQVVWEPTDQRQADGIPRMQDAFVDNTVVKEQVIHKIVEIKVWDEHHKKKAKKPKRSDSSSEESALDADEEEIEAVMKDI